MRKTRGTVAAGIAAALTLALLAACSSTNTGGATSTTKPQSDFTLTVSRWSGPQADEQQKLLDQYTKETGVKVRMDAIDYASLQPKQTLNMNTKTGQYDLVYMPEAWVGQYVKSNFLVDLSKYVKDESLTGKNWDFADIQKSGIDTYTVNGKLYGLPYFVQMPLLVYNKTQLKKDGFAVPQTWSDILTVAHFYKSQGTGIALPFRQGTAISNVLAVLLAGNGTGFFDESGKLDLTNPSVVQAVQFIQDVSKDGLQGSNGWHWDEVAKALTFGQAPLGITTTGLFSQIENPTQSKVAGQMGYAPIPYNKKAAGLIQSWAWGIPKDSKHAKAAFQLAAWLTSKSAQTAFAKMDPSFVTFRQSVDDDKSLAANAPWLPAIKEALTNGVTLPLQPAASQLLTDLSAGLSGVVTNGDDPKAMLQKVQQADASKF